MISLFDLADMQLFRHCNKRNNHFLSESLSFYSFHIRINIGRQVFIFFSHDIIAGYVSSILAVMPDIAWAFLRIGK